MHTRWAWRRYAVWSSDAAYMGYATSLPVAFDIDCGALDDAVHPIVHAYKNMLYVFMLPQANIAGTRKAVLEPDADFGTRVAAPSPWRSLRGPL